MLCRTRVPRSQPLHSAVAFEIWDGDSANGILRSEWKPHHGTVPLPSLQSMLEADHVIQTINSTVEAFQSVAYLSRIPPLHSPRKEVIV